MDARRFRKKESIEDVPPSKLWVPGQHVGRVTLDCVQKATELADAEAPVEAQAADEPQEDSQE